MYQAIPSYWGDLRSYQKRRYNQLRLVVEMPLFTGFSKTSQVVVWDFWTINSILDISERSHTFFPFTCFNHRLKKVIGAACAGWWDAKVVVDRKVVRILSIQFFPCDLQIEMFTPRKSNIDAQNDGFLIVSPFKHGVILGIPETNSKYPWKLGL